MADRIKGITIEIDGDTTKLSKSLSGVNRNIGDTKRELKDVERLLKLDPTNTKLLEQRQRLLSNAVAETSEKLKTLKEAEKQAQEQFAKGEISQKQYDGLQREIFETEKSLVDLARAASKSNVALSKISAVAGELSDKTASLASKTKVASAAAAGLIGAAAGIAVKAATAADDLNTLSKQSGFSTETLQTWQYGADLVDVSVDDIVGAAKKLKKNMDSTSSDVASAWGKIGVSPKTASGEWRDVEDVFYDVVHALSQVENETERDILAMSLFGKSADSLAGIIDDGGAAFREYGEQAKEAGLILSQDALDSANKFNDAIDTFKAKSSGAFAKTGTEIIEMLLPHLDSLFAYIDQAVMWFSNLDDGQLKTIGIIALLIASISPLLSMISKVSSAVEMLTSTVIPGLGNALTFMTSPIGIVIAAITALIAIIAIFGDDIQAKLQEVDDFLQNVFAKDWTDVFGTGLGEVLNGFFRNVKNTWDAFKKILDGIIDFIRGVFTLDWERAWNGLVKVFSGVFDGLSAAAKAPINAIISLVNGAIGGINTLIRGINKIPGVSISEIGKIPMLAKGGKVLSGSAIVGEAGPELLTVMGGAATVQPLSNTSNSTTNMGGITINVYGAQGQDESEIAEKVAYEIEQLTMQKGAVFV